MSGEALSPRDGESMRPQSPSHDDHGDSRDPGASYQDLSSPIRQVFGIKDKEKLGIPNSRMIDLLEEVQEQPGVVPLSPKPSFMAAPLRVPTQLEPRPDEPGDDVEHRYDKILEQDDDDEAALPPGEIDKVMAIAEQEGPQEIETKETGDEDGTELRQTPGAMFVEKQLMAQIKHEHEETQRQKVLDALDAQKAVNGSSEPEDEVSKQKALLKKVEDEKVADMERQEQDRLAREAEERHKKEQEENKKREEEELARRLKEEEAKQRAVAVAEATARIQQQQARGEFGENEANPGKSRVGEVSLGIQASFSPPSSPGAVAKPPTVPSLAEEPSAPVVQAQPKAQSAHPAPTAAPAPAPAPAPAHPPSVNPHLAPTTSVRPTTPRPSVVASPPAHLQQQQQQPAAKQPSSCCIIS